MPSRLRCRLVSLLSASEVRFAKAANLCGKGRSAAARFRRVGIDEVEALPHQRLLIVEDHAVQVDKGLGIDKDADIAELVDAIPLPRLRVETDVIGKPGATAARDAKTQTTLGGRNALLGHGDANALNRALGHLDSLLLGSLVFGVQNCKLRSAHL